MRDVEEPIEKVVRQAIVGPLLVRSRKKVSVRPEPLRDEAHRYSIGDS